MFAALGAQPAVSAIGPSVTSAPDPVSASELASVVPNGVVVNVERLLQARWASIESAAGQETEASVPSITSKMSALRDLRRFMHTTVGGLMAASESAGGHGELKDQLSDVLSRWTLKIGNAMDALDR